MKNLNTNKIVSTAAASLLTLSAFAFAAAPSYAASSLAGGDFLQAHDVSTGGDNLQSWTDPLTVNPGDLVEFRIKVVNDGDQVDERVWVNGQVPQETASTFSFPATIRGTYNGSTPLSDSATINIANGSQQFFRYAPGHVRLFGVTSTYNCPNGCNLPDGIVPNGLEIGDIQPGDTIQIAYKAQLSNYVPSASPTDTPTQAPTAAPTIAPTQAPTQTQEQTQNNNQNVTINNPAPVAPQVVTVAATGDVKQLPNTGLPIAAWGLGGLIPLGIKFRKFAGQAKDIVTPSFLWEKRNQA